jgi:hypothetical protein
MLLCDLGFTGDTLNYGRFFTSKVFTRALEFLAREGTVKKSPDAIVREPDALKLMPFMLSGFWQQLETSIKAFSSQATIGGGIGEIQPNMWDVINDFVRGVDNGEWKAVPANDVLNGLDHILRVITRNQVNTSGPLSLQQSRNTTIHNVETPTIRLGYAEQWVDLEPRALWWWEKTQLEPYAGSKRVRLFRTTNKPDSLLCHLLS